MMLIAGEGNDAQGLSVAEVTVNSPATVPTITTSSSSTTSSAAMPSSSTAATLSHKAKEKVMANKKLKINVILRLPHYKAIEIMQIN